MTDWVRAYIYKPLMMFILIIFACMYICIYIYKEREREILLTELQKIKKQIEFDYIFQNNI